MSDSVENWNMDLVFVPKKWKIFDKNDNLSIVEFEKDIRFILKKVFLTK